MDLNRQPPRPYLSTVPGPNGPEPEISLNMRPRCLGPDPEAFYGLDRDDLDRIHAAAQKRLRKAGRGQELQFRNGSRITTG